MHTNYPPDWKTNKIIGPPPFIVDFKNLNWLELNFVGYVGFDFSAVTHLKKLTKLELASNKLEKLDVALLKLTTLKHLDVSKNQLKDIPRGMLVI